MKQTLQKAQSLAHEQKKIIQHHMDKKLSKRMKIYIGLSLVMLAIEIYEVIISHYNPWLACLFVLASIVIGFFFSRMFHLTRNPDEEVVTSTIDRLGGIILVLYIVVSILRQTILNDIFHNPPIVLVISFAIIAGMMIGRLIGMQYKARKILKENNIL